MLRKIVRSLPPVANRDAQLRALRSELRSARASQAKAAAEAEAAAASAATAEAELEARRQAEAAASFHYKLHEARRIRALVEATGRAAPVWDVNDKASGYRFAESHGVRTPAKYGHYDSPRDIDWASLPEMFVIKTIKGTTSLGVIPVQRVGEGRYQDLLSRHKDEYTTEQMVERLDGMVHAGTVSNELYLEELLLPPQGTDLSVVPDVKLYAFYGEVGMVMVSGRRFRGPAGVTFRFFDAEGTDLGAVRPDVRTDAALPAPRFLQEAVEAGRVMSGAVREPFVRLDFYEDDTGIVFGEVTPAPGGDQLMRPDVDARLGAMWEAAEARLKVDAIARGMHDLSRGSHPITS